MQMIFYAAMIWVVLIWALIIGVTIRNVVVAVRNRGKSDGGGKTPANVAATPDGSITIAGMPAQTYYSTYASIIDDTIH